MLKYFYYLWNLLKSSEKISLFHHFGQCLLSAILYTIIDWQHLILIWIITQYPTNNLIYAVVGVQFFVWGISLWYYYLKYQMMTIKNNFFKLLSTRHYDYILKRLAKNSSFVWLNEKSSIELAKQIDSSDKGLQHIFSFVTLFVKLIGIILMSLLVISFNYQICAILFVLFSGGSYYFATRKLVYKDSNSHSKFQDYENSLIISDQISLLLDSVLHNDYDQLIKNILNFNKRSKIKLTNLYAEQDKMYTKIGLGLMTGYVFTLILITLSMRFKFEQFTIFFIASLLTYKCLSNNINQLLDKFTDVRQSYFDFEMLNDIWSETKTKRIKFKQEYLPTEILEIDNWINFNSYMFEKNDSVQIKTISNLIKNNSLQSKFKNYILLCKDYKFKKGSYIDKIYQLELMKKFAYGEKLEYETTNLKNLYENFISTELKKSDIFQIKLFKMHFAYLTNDNTEQFEISYNSEQPLIWKSNDKILVDGESGSGKTTLLKILRGVLPLKLSFEEEQNFVSMELSYKNELKYISWNNLSSNISYYQQNSLSFNQGNIYQIITGDFITKYDNVDESEKKIIHRALDIACVEIKFRQLNHKISKNTISGGQKQRISIAKNIYRLLKDDKQIIILDEIDTGIDDRIALKIILNLLILLKNKLVFIVTHSNNLKKLFNDRITIKSGIIQKLP